MNWLVVVIFSGVVGGYQDLYILQQPSFVSKEECRTGLGSEELRVALTKQLTKEYTAYKPIERIVCATQKQIQQVLNDSYGKRDT